VSSTEQKAAGIVKLTKSKEAHKKVLTNVPEEFKDQLQTKFQQMNFDTSAAIASMQPQEIKKLWEALKDKKKMQVVHVAMRQLLWILC